MTMRDWSEAPFVRVYSTLGQDHPRVYRDLRLLGGYVRLLMAADAAWPGSAEVPRSMPADVLAELEADEVIDVEGDFYRFHGLEAERRGRIRGAAIGGRARARSADRDDHGRFLPSDDEPLDGPLDEPSSPAGPAAGRNGSSDRLVAPAGSPADQRASQPSRAEPLGSGSARLPARPRASAPAREPDAPARVEPSSPTSIRCRDYQAHRSEHRFWGEGIGWKCQVCEREDADAEAMRLETFTTKLERAAARGRDELDDDRPF